MSFYLRKSIRVGPIRFNLSKSGIGVSGGVKGLRIGTGPKGNYIHMGRGGIYYRKTLGGRRGRRPNLAEFHDLQVQDTSSDELASPSAHDVTITALELGDVSQMAHSSSAELLQEINDKKEIPRIGPWVLGGTVALVVFGLAASVNALLLLILAAGLAVGVYYAFQRDAVRKTVVLLYNFDPELEQAYANLHAAAMQLAGCAGLWYFKAAEQVRDQKYQAGASQLIDRGNITITTTPPSFLRTNIQIIAIVSGRLTLYFLPDRLLVSDSRKVGAVGYDELALEVTQTTFIERSAPRDARVVDHTWQYVNKTGGPDRRFANNPQLPVCLYDRLHFTSRSGLNEIIQVSRCGVGESLSQAIKGLASCTGSPSSSFTPNIEDFSDYELPSFDLLDVDEFAQYPETNREELLFTQRVIIDTIMAFGINVKPGDITRGPTFTRYEVYPSVGAQVPLIARLEADIARATCVERINILMCNSDKDSVGVEIANSQKILVPVYEPLLDPEFRAPENIIPLALGRDIYGNSVICDLVAMPHLLIAGNNGSGKSVCINSIIASILFKFGPDELRFIMVNMMERQQNIFNRLPHMLLPVISDLGKVLAMLDWIINEMEGRHRIFAKEGVHDFDHFNSRPRSESVTGTRDQKNLKRQVSGDNRFPDRFPYLVVVIDELADLMQSVQEGLDKHIAYIAQNGRATGVHLIIATHTPQADVVTDIINASIPGRIAFQLDSSINSLTILRNPGAEKLFGEGDMYYLLPGKTKLGRAQGAFISSAEIERIVECCAGQIERNHRVNM
ncbi:MAG: DNA translocase FtsK [Verrucomicrobia bacterium]|nr:DNA translocase FtsK [Verrucomicrobiota bacterium]